MDVLTVFREIDILKGESVVGRTNNRIPPLRPGDKAVLNFAQYT
jgi:hypothetical protein